MKIHFNILLAFGVLCAGSTVWLAVVPNGPATDQAELSMIVPVPDEPREPAVDAVHSGSPENETESVADAEPVSIPEWHAEHSKLLEKSGDSKTANEAVVAELDEKYHSWICARLAELSKLAPDERYQALAQMESRIQSVSESILGHLGVAGAKHIGVLTRSVEAISAEIQYAEMPGTHEARVAMLRLDREREARFEKLVAASEPGADTEAQVLSEITPWYEARMREIVGGDDAE